jgi:NTP pyrophosphatase (non-canonical NTP hydrolase)
VELDEYQNKANRTDQFPVGDGASGGQEALQIPLFGLIGEIGSLLTTFKKRIRDKEAYSGFERQAKEELGDILWYLTNLATKLGLSLDQIANENLAKVTDRWPHDPSWLANYELLDSVYPASEQLPRTLALKFSERVSDITGAKQVLVETKDQCFGDPLTDNSIVDDGYRYHDAFHFAYAAVLGWSPVVRHLLYKKRESDPLVREVQDGGRARVIEEAISAIVYAEAERHSLFRDVTEVDLNILDDCRRLTRHLEVSARTRYDWKMAILAGYKIFRHLKENNGGTVYLDLTKRRIWHDEESIDV